MWEFVENKFVQPPRWTWAKVGATGRAIQRSPTAYRSLGMAISNAMLYGFDGAVEPFQLIELE